MGERNEERTGRKSKKAMRKKEKRIEENGNGRKWEGKTKGI